MHQVVIYLQPTTSELGKHSAFVLENTRYEFGVICFWEQPSEIFLNTPGLLPFATLSQPLWGSQKSKILNPILRQAQ
ncbi:hypothetical protein [Nostoc sp.]|uniref:hypothetical protein n=1 Tax=Nostoc sp. TaxID=1180 RepID=UPI003FA58D72